MGYYSVVYINHDFGVLCRDPGASTIVITSRLGERLG